jgi:hypothetical protein
MTIIGSVNMDRLIKALASFPPKTEKTQDEFLTDQVRLLISNARGSIPGILQLTPPSSKGVKGEVSKLQGEKRIMSDFAKVYKSPWHVFKLIENSGKKNMAAGYWKAYRAKDYKRMIEIVRAVGGLPSWCAYELRAFDGGDAIKKRRSKSTGRVNGKTPSMLCNDPTGLAEYRKVRLGRVGLLASIIPTAAISVLTNIKGIPKFVKRHNGSGGGHVIPIHRAKGKLFKIGIGAYAGNEMQRRMNFALQYRINSIGRQSKAMAKRLEKKLQDQLNAA